ncbi:MAG: hypothetical protein ACK5NT_02360 [Pyrinomonadaceae bacterium]
MKYFAIVLCFLLSTVALASEPQVWSINTRDEILRGTSKGVSISDSGAVTVSPAFTETYATGQSYIWSSEIDSKGNVYLGTGADGKIFRIDSSGKGSLFADTEELNVSALAIAPDGNVFAGTSPDGKVYKITPEGKISVYFEPKEKYIWSLAVLSDGNLVVGTGEAGKIYKVRGANAAPNASVFFDSSETHIISLAVDSKNNIYAGTDPGGYVLKFGADGKGFALLDTELNEVHKLVLAKDDSLYVLALGESASSKPAETSDKKAEPLTVSVSEKKSPVVATPLKSKYDVSGAKSALYRIKPSGENDLLWRSFNAAAFALVPSENGNGAIIGTSDRGRILSVSNDGDATLILQTEEEQVSTLNYFANKLFAATSNMGKLYRIEDAAAAVGSFESPVLDAKSTATWGSIWWRANGNVQIQTRSGNTAQPNELWSDWVNAGAGGNGQIGSPSAQFLQWRAVLSGNSAELFEVSASFLQRNIAPEIQSIDVLPANVGLASNPEIFVDPNIASAGLNPSDFGIIVPPTVPRRIFQNGARSFQWKGFDRNNDELIYSVYYRRDNDSEFILLRDGLTTPYLTLDGLALADGRYFLKVVASDAPSNSATTKLTGEMISEPFYLDNTPPTVSSSSAPVVSGNNVSASFDANEAESRILRAEYSVDGMNWKTVNAEDGITDGKNEKFNIRVTLDKPGLYSITLRVFDSNGNAGSARVVVRR